MSDYSPALKELGRGVLDIPVCYRNNPKNWDRHARANSVDPDQMLQNAASDQCLHCLSLIQQYFRHINRK